MRQVIVQRANFETNTDSAKSYDITLPDHTNLIAVCVTVGNPTPSTDQAQEDIHVSIEYRKVDTTASAGANLGQIKLDQGYIRYDNGGNSKHLTWIGRLPVGTGTIIRVSTYSYVGTTQLLAVNYVCET